MGCHFRDHVQIPEVMPEAEFTSQISS
ncbi:hypothetical protein ARSEF4850_009382 [Beauveria asiatica]